MRRVVRSDDIKIRKVDEVFLEVTCNRGIAYEIREYFSFYAHNYKFMPLYKNRMWDGKIYLFKDGLLYLGLLGNLYQFAQERGYSINHLESSKVTLGNQEIEEFITELNLPFTPRDYQVDSLRRAIEDRRILILSSTGSGKSLSLYMITRYLQRSQKKGLLIVPTVSLVEQMNKDFKNYGWDVEGNCHKIYSGEDKKTSKYLSISTWQSLFKMPKSFFQDFDFVIVDECHQAKAKSITGILEKCSNAKYRVGATGTLDGVEVNKMVLEGLLGGTYKATSTADLMEKGSISKLKINCLVLKYPDNVSRLIRGADYQREIDWLVGNEERNRFIVNLASRLKNNTLILFQFIEKHGDILFRLLEELTGRQVFYVHGGVSVEDREMVRDIAERNSNVIILASYGCFSTGISVNNIDNIIFALSGKSRVRNLQSIGRGLRLNEGKEFATLYDLSDDLRGSKSKKANHSLKHLEERLKIYASEQFPFKITNINLRGD